ncbi:transmembrane and immunoglobulin domain-containing protein 1 isoform X2 [Corythoichthys intestinalis]|uniref:transmembrane and immunoglobulin domain-containing protein 1 isoform X2 n=1 Tax=Corythoichthys intestinalis TaxID=161448 RepID=UPI0025A5ADF0|nr:transmembrane and immunoglobulin domain-containing protein 1 isoform X2 [Corythoichthys intestinalis]XP_061801628.1 transmembrane and immunoglobulin domain-containing protein 1 [Nerophis lumbriciformis]
MASYCFLVFALCASQTLSITIESVPSADVGGVILTELETTVSLVCRSNRFEDEEAELVWLRNGAKVALKEGNRQGQSTVCITPVIHQDNGATFTCHMGGNASVEASVTLNVTYPPTLSGSEEVWVEDASPLFLQCDTFSNPPVSSVHWTFNGSTLDLLAGGFTIAEDGYYSRLSANKAEKSKHEGLYRCVADSPVYGIKSKDFLVTVTEKTVKFPLMPIIAGVVVVCLTTILAIFSRWDRIVKCCK